LSGGIAHGDLSDLSDLIFAAAAQRRFELPDQKL
jgi:hypothetical protein